MMRETTNCPTCGQECFVEGNTTKYYVRVVPDDTAALHDAQQRIEELEAECNDLAHQLNQCNERDGHIITENKRLKKELETCELNLATFNNIY